MDKKSKQLGINVSTAMARLDRMILFMLVKENGRDTCYRCGASIESYKDLSTEHKLPWLDASIELFWDLSNIAFSHKKCNTLAHRKVRPSDESIQRLQESAKNFVKNAPAGKAWCAGHKEFHPVGQFAHDKHQTSGYRAHCKKYRASKPW